MTAQIINFEDIKYCNCKESSVSILIYSTKTKTITEKSCDKCGRNIKESENNNG